MIPPFRPDAGYAQELDARDDLVRFRQQFVIDDPTYIYLDGNSLGRLPRVTVERLQQVVEQEWGRRLIRSWNEGWFDLPERVGAKMAVLLGASPDEVIMADSTSVNLYKLALAALQVQSGRTKIVTDELNFPSDLYILQGVVRLAGPAYRLEVVPAADELSGPVEQLAGAIDEETALVVLTHTIFKSGYTYDMATLTELAHRAGALILWDCSHSVGAMPIALNAAAVDLAVGCSYKYLNGGPGAPAFLYVRRDWQERLNNPISGWMGQHSPFAFALDYQPAPGLRRFLTGTPSILALAAVEAGLELLLEAGLERVRAKSVQQTEYLVALWEALLAPLGFRLKSPRQPEHRGSHVTLGHDEGLRIDQALIHEMSVQPDFRRPDNIRFGIAPLYNTFTELHEAVQRLRTVVTEQLYEKYPAEGPAVT
ncbi:MAG: kynureninase [Chloroflexi bacterium]|nr:kynureninase [Chloroflexota bacterium]MCI0574705.1 kynureninase [Chloroflexota bacterium]MCI0647402.1 kynureninase [Chloroflexota bacterium]MCI0728881.1 kynureninase [Chloroflexota bacterium]